MRESEQIQETGDLAMRNYRKIWKELINILKMLN